MLERFIQDLQTDDANGEAPAATRERLKAAFPPGGVRRMTQLGMLTGAALNKLGPQPNEALIYASTYGESRSLESYLDSFPTPSPTLFQTSIHPSGAQQGLIGRQRSVGELFPVAGTDQMAAQALLAAMLAPAEQAVICGGEERGTWLVDYKSAAERTYGYAMRLVRTTSPQALGKVILRPSDANGELEPGAWFDLLHQRKPFDAVAADGWHLQLTWF